MKTLLCILACAICARCFGADAANDIILIQRKSDNSGPVQRNVAPVATGLLGTDGSKLPVPITIGANLTLSGTPLTLTASVSGGSGNVTNNAALASGNIVIGGGTTVVGTTNISVSGGNNISNVGTINVTTINATSLTSTSATSNGQVPMWNVTNGNFTISTITQGSNVTITNGAGSITIDSNFNGNVTAAGTLGSGNIVIGGGSKATSTTTTGTGVVTAVGVNVGSAGAFVVNGGALGTPSSGTGTNITGIPAANISSGALANGMTATTQSAGSADTKVATDAYADTAALASHLGTFASPNTAAGSITWTSPVYNIYTSAGATRTYTLPAASTYVNRAFILNVAVGTGHVNVQPASGAALVLAGVLLTADHYVQAATSAPGNYICFVSDGTNWTSLGSSGTWADAASP